MHGKTSRITHDGRGIFRNIPSPLEVMRYHSLVVETDSLPAELEIIARAKDDTAMKQAEDELKRAQLEIQRNEVVFPKPGSHLPDRYPADGDGRTAAVGLWRTRI